MSDILITLDDQGRTFEANQGDLIVIRLAENMTTGYMWELETRTCYQGFQSVSVRGQKVG
jgi:predicted secreted protein